MSREIQAAVLRSQPGVLALETLLLDDPTDREVVVDVAYAGLCHSDLHEIDGTFETELPIVLGHEVSGIVSAVGGAVRDFHPGDRVVTCLSAFCGTCRYCTAGRQTLCTERSRLMQDRPRPRLMGSDGPVRATAGIGGFAQAVVVHESAVVRIADTIRLDTASVLGCAVTTGMGAVLRRANVRPGDAVAVIGAGGVGVAAIQAARMVGATPIVAIDVVKSKLRVALEHGATHTVDASREDAVSRVHELTNGGVAHAFEAVGRGATVGQAFEMLEPGGTATVMGMVHPSDSIPISGPDLFMGEKRLQGSFMGSNHFKTDIPSYIELAAAGRLDLDALVTSCVPLADVQEGFRRLGAGAEIRVVAEVGGTSEPPVPSSDDQVEGTMQESVRS